VFQTKFKQKANLRSFQKVSGLQWRKIELAKVTLRLQESVIPAILPWVLLCSGYGFLVTLIYELGEWQDFINQPNGSEVIPDLILSFNVLSLLLGLRTNSANDRFWEAGLWGSLVNTVRNLARGIWIIIEEREPNDREEKEAALRLVVAFTVAMKLHLRRESVNHELVDVVISGISSFKKWIIPPRNCLLDWGLSAVSV